jgi:Undecaprenyl-phosphate glucose phosphotransferase
MLVDFILLATVGFLIEEQYVNSHNLQYLLAVLAISGLVVAIMAKMGLYAINALLTPWQHLHRLALGVAIPFSLFITALFLIKTSSTFSRVWLSSWILSSLITLLLSRIGLNVLAQTLLRRGFLRQNTILLGTPKAVATLIEKIGQSGSHTLNLLGYFTTQPSNNTAECLLIPHLGGVDDILPYSHTTPIDLLILAAPEEQQGNIITPLRTQLMILPFTQLVETYGSFRFFHRGAYTYIGTLPFVPLSGRPLAEWDEFKKAVFDKTIATLALLALAPVMLAVALAIRLESKGPILFKQQRYGFNNKLVGVYKFRSMYAENTDSDGSKSVTQNDKRVTKVGRFIRKSSLDELPQLFNVLKGDLSLVGPRPHATQSKAANQLFHEVVEEYFARHKVKPGITGWAQINGWRGETDTEEKIRQRVAYDLYYIENWSLMLDAYILLATPFSLFTTKNAY